MSSNAYHIPVLLHAAVNGLNVQPHGNYVDVTFGGGGHSREILKHLSSGKLFGFDQDPDAKNNVPPNENFVFIPQNFCYLSNYLTFYGAKQVDGILADLGVSSHQFDDTDRGFSIRNDAFLDMRMNKNQELSAIEVVNDYPEEKLKTIFKSYGELQHGANVAKYIAKARSIASVNTTHDLIQALAPIIPKKNEKQFLAQVFQAIRIEVNGELDVLEDFLKQALDFLKPGGRLVVISYHSLEDRLVKNFMRTGKMDGEVEKDFYGNPITPLEQITKKPIVPTAEEIEQNPRARSAKLRIAEKK
jgi:16S rRNA (cytosine1402-N4)-methyltransferase